MSVTSTRLGEAITMGRTTIIDTASGERGTITRTADGALLFFPTHGVPRPIADPGRYRSEGSGRPVSAAW